MIILTYEQQRQGALVSLLGGFPPGRLVRVRGTSTVATVASAYPSSTHGDVEVWHTLDDGVAGYRGNLPARCVEADMRSGKTPHTPLV